MAFCDRAEDRRRICKFATGAGSEMRRNPPVASTAPSIAADFLESLAVDHSEPSIALFHEAGVCESFDRASERRQGNGQELRQIGLRHLDPTVRIRMGRRLQEQPVGHALE